MNVNVKNFESMGNGVKSLAIGAGILVGLYTLWQLADTVAGIADFFGGKKDDYKHDPIVPTDRKLNAAEYKYMTGQYTYEQAARELYPERYDGSDSRFVNGVIARPGGNKVATAESIDWEAAHAEG